MTIQPSRAVDATLAANQSRVLSAKRVFTGTTGTHLSDSSVVIVDGQIAWVGSTTGLPAEYAQLPVTDYGDATILPGLIETHAHLASYTRVAQPDVTDPTFHDKSWETLSSVKIARQLASLGVTSVQSLGAAAYVDVALREAINVGLIAGPRIVAAGPPVTLTGGHGWNSGGETDSIPEILHQVREHHKAGADVIKVMATGGFMSHSTCPWNAQFTTEEFKALIDDAHRLGKRVASHAHGTQGIARVTEAGIDFIAHASFVDLDGQTRFDPRVADEIARKGIFTDSSSVPVYPEVDGPEGAPIVWRLYEHGVLLTPGHDIGAVYPASAYTFGLKQLEAAGLPRGEILVAATSRAAAAIGYSGITGVLAPGFAADVIVATGDPLANLDALDSLQEVIIGGRTFDREYVAPFDPEVRLARDVAAPGGPNDKRADWIAKQQRVAEHPIVHV
ncbi:MAG: amidohydrolase family protein [Propionibacteriaceae bacterium]|jgi:imidazolonepropionase-like amidohydrolase|nr:amidohydrolase family protein [Propionibacteriaceae bacterium]